MGSTLRLVIAATVVAILFGVTIGIISALRQYTGFDYVVTFLAFLFFSLPIFWVAVLLKEFGAIRVNDWLAGPDASRSPVVVALTLLAALAWQAILGGSRRRRLLVALVAAAATAAVLVVPVASPSGSPAPPSGPVLVVLISLGWAARRHVPAGRAAQPRRALLRGRRRPRWSSCGSAALRRFLSRPLVDVHRPLRAGHRRRRASWPGTCSAASTGRWPFAPPSSAASSPGSRSSPTTSSSPSPGTPRRVSGVVVKTIGSGTPNFEGTFWEVFLDRGLSLVLPTTALILISFATYVRYTRASMLEVLNMDYVRTARAKGLTERTVTVRHAFRNALIPVTTLAAFDFGAVIGGAVITETVFGWSGMGALFRDGPADPRPEPRHGVLPGHGRPRRPVQPDRRHRLRLPRPADQALVSVAPAAHQAPHRAPVAEEAP